MKMDSKKILTEYIAKKGIEIDKYVKPIDKLLSKLNISCRPMIFWEFWKVCFGVVMCLMFSMIIFSGDQKSKLDAILLSGLAALIFGTYIAWKNGRDRAKLGFPPWEKILDRD